MILDHFGVISSLWVSLDPCSRVLYSLGSLFLSSLADVRF